MWAGEVAAGAERVGGLVASVVVSMAVSEVVSAAKNEIEVADRKIPSATFVTSFNMRTAIGRCLPTFVN